MTTFRGNVPRPTARIVRTPAPSGPLRTHPAPLCFSHDDVTLEPGGTAALCAWIAPEAGTLRSCAVHLAGVRGIGALSVLSSFSPDPLPVDTGVNPFPDAPVAQHQTVDLRLHNDSEEAIYIKRAAVTAMFAQ
jgi:hypothetical protein